MDRPELLRARDSLTKELDTINVSLDVCRQHMDGAIIDLASTKALLEQLENSKKECAAKLRKITSLLA
jgi:hypothetical protein